MGTCVYLTILLYTWSQLNKQFLFHFTNTDFGKSDYELILIILFIQEVGL